MPAVRPMILIMLPLLILIGVGAMTNNFSSNGFSTTADSSSCTSLNCPAYTATGCSAAISNCNFTSSTTFSFLNPNSPFTYLMSGDILGFAGSFSGGSGTGTSQASAHTVALYCTTVSGSGTSITSFTCKAASSLADANYPFPIYNATSTGNNSLWYVVGNQGLNNFEVTPTQPAPFTFYGGYFGNNTVINSVTAGEKFTCTLKTGENYCLVPLPSPSTANLTNVFSFLGFMIGVLLLVLSLGIGFSGEALTVGFSFSSNPQGTRLAQTAGIGLLLWFPMYSEFSGWISNLGFGVSAMVTVILPAIFFVGIYWQMESYL